jgi:Tfp pilus assembly protein PilF
MFQAYAQKNNVDKMRYHLTQTILIEPEHVAARIALAQLSYQSGDKEETQVQISALQKIAPENPQVKLIDAILKSSEGGGTEALALLDQLNTDSSSRTTLLALAEQEKRMGRTDEALARLQDWISEQPGDIPVMLQIAALHDQDNDGQAAAAQYEQLLELSRSHVIALNNLAWLLRESQPKNALVYIKKAYEIAPTSADIADTYAVVLFNNQDYKLAMKMSERATSDTDVNTGDADAFYHQSLIAHALGEDERAKQLLSALLDTGREFKERESAQNLLAKIVIGVELRK